MFAFKKAYTLVILPRVCLWGSKLLIQCHMHVALGPALAYQPHQMKELNYQFNDPPVGESFSNSLVVLFLC